MKKTVAAAAVFLLCTVLSMLSFHAGLIDVSIALDAACAVCAVFICLVLQREEIRRHRPE